MHVDDLVDVRIADPELCSRYTARVVRGVKIGPSPAWLAERVTAAGMRPINNVVDVTNYVMMLTGQPLHAFDLGKLTERDGRRHVVVRAARDGEQIVTLDEPGARAHVTTCASSPTTATRPVCLAGVMGSLRLRDRRHHARRAARGRVLRLEPHLAHEPRPRAHLRGVHPLRAPGRPHALRPGLGHRGGALRGVLRRDRRLRRHRRVPVRPSSRHELTLRQSRVELICGAPIEPEFVERSLARLGCAVERAAADGEPVFRVVPPTFRPDLEREIDLIEEVLRLWGMGRVEATIPAAKNHIGGLTHDQRLLRRIGAIMRSCGLNETTTYSFAAPGDLEQHAHERRGPRPARGAHEPARRRANRDAPFASARAAAVCGL